MNTSQKRFTRIFAMLLALVMAAGTFSGCQKNDREPLGTELELLAEETIAPPAAEETEPETKPCRK